MYETPDTLFPPPQAVKAFKTAYGETRPHERWFVRLLNRKLLTWETFVMPRKGQTTGKRNNQFSTTFVNMKLSVQEGKAFRAWLEKLGENAEKEISAAIGKGMKFSFSETGENGSYLASMTCRDEGSVNYDCCITSRSNSWWEALLMCAFKGGTLGWDNPWVDQTSGDDWG